ncbi:MAG: hypothetical protein ABS81_10240 [Pseudonocardia sp. SCN 72-86]|nr:MAG: hypothetical protein ABS81_10240 [Pseudonocardia sp. SCN 72-86]
MSAIVAVVVCTVLFVLPVVTIVIGAFRSAAPGQAGHWTVEPLLRTWSDPHTFRTLGDSVLLAVSVAVLATLLGSYLAFLVARTDTPLRRIVLPLAALVLAMPPLFFAISWSLVGNGTVGLLNTVWQALTGTDWNPVNIESWAGLILVATLKTTGLVVLLLTGAFRAMDRSQEEAAIVSGASRTRVFFGIDLPALAPAVLGVAVLAVIVGMEYFDLPLIIGTPAGISVFATEIYSSLNAFVPPRYPEASALALMLVLVLLVLLLLQTRALGGRDFATVRGKSGRAEVWRLGAWRGLGTAVIVLYALLALVLPLLQLVLVSLAPFFGVYDRPSLRNYTSALSDPDVTSGLLTTAGLAIGGGLVAVLVAVLVSYVARRSSRFVAGYLRVTTWLPWSLPGTALALGLLWTLLVVPFASGLYGTAALLLIGLVLAATPIGMRTVEPVIGQIAGDLEEAAWTSGARPGRAFRDVVLRLVAPSLLTGWLLASILVAGNLAIPLMLGSLDTVTVPSLVYELYGSGNVPEAAAVLCLMLAGFALLGVVALAVSTWSARGRGRPGPAVPAPTRKDYPR